MRGGRTSRGRGGRGRGEEGSVELPDPAGSHSDSDEDEANSPTTRNEEREVDSSRKTQLEKEVKGELVSVKTQLETLKQQIAAIGNLENRNKEKKDPSDAEHLQLGNQDEFPILGNAQESRQSVTLSSWRDKEVKDTQQIAHGKEGEKHVKEKQMWIPKNIAQLIKGTTSLEDIRARLNSGNNERIDSSEELLDTAEATQTADPILIADQTTSDGVKQHGYDVQEGILDKGEDDGGGWTPVPPGKSAKRAQYSNPIRSTVSTPNCLKISDTENTNEKVDQQRGGNPQFPLEK
ncbi:unnamed protein product [Amaranthus hypochondriacus]